MGQQDPAIPVWESMARESTRSLPRQQPPVRCARHGPQEIYKGPLTGGEAQSTSRPWQKSLLSFSPENTQNSAAQGWVKSVLEGSAEVTLKVGRCLTQYTHTQEGTRIFAISSGKKLIDLTRRNSEAQI